MATVRGAATSVPARAKFFAPTRAGGRFWRVLWRLGPAVWLLAGWSARAAGPETNAPAFPDLTNRAWAQFSSNHWTSAEPLFRSALQLKTNNVETLRGLAESLYGSDDYRRAITAYQQILALRPNDTNAHWRLGLSYYYLKDYRESAGWFRKLIALEPKAGRAYYRLSGCLDWLRQYPEAEEASRRALEISPTNVEFQIRHAFCLECLKRDPEAITEINRILSRNPANVEALNLLAIGYYHVKQYSQSIIAYNQVLALNPTNHEARLHLGVNYYLMDDYPAAITNFQRYVAAEPGDFSGFDMLARSLAAADRDDEAAGALQKALQIKPRSFSANLRRGSFLFLAGRYSEAMTNLEIAHAVKPEDRDARHILFGCYLLTARYQQARDTAPKLCLIVGSVLMLGYLAGSVALLKFSFKVRPKLFPSLWFALAWFSLFFEGQLACLCVLWLLSFAHVNEGPLAGIILAGIPVITTAAWGFSRQPWGKPFAWPPPVSPRIVWMSLLALAVLLATDSAYSALYTLVTRRPFPVQETVPMLNFAVAANPVAATLAIALVGPMVEEILFRGLIYGALLRRLPVGAVVVLSSILFAVAHVQPVYFIPLFAAGFALAWLRWQSGSLGPSMVVHCLNNGLSLLFLKLFENAP